MPELNKVRAALFSPRELQQKTSISQHSLGVSVFDEFHLNGCDQKDFQYRRRNESPRSFPLPRFDLESMYNFPGFLPRYSSESLHLRYYFGGISYPNTPD
eukprot:gb/GECG01016217.1/.p1 GENE.gb/GECG01016217.1/~~gb/GECG01016217.1/.p1  ORF type:complete len:100 (+),score=7.78 gb/GECG01016217.1/:1-300(+)